MHDVPDPGKVTPPAGQVLPTGLRSAVIVAISAVAFVAAMNMTALAASIHPLLGVVALPIVVAAALSITEAVCERLAPDVLCAFRRCWRGVATRLHVNS